MRSVPLALTWELLARGRRDLIAAVLGANAFPLLVFSAIFSHGKLDVSDPSMIVMHFALAQVVIAAIISAVVAAQGATARLYAYPVTAGAVVTWQMLPAMAITALVTAVSLGAQSAIFQLDWSIWGLTLFAATATAAVRATLWLFDRSAWAILMVILLAIVLGWWLSGRYGGSYSQPANYWTQVTLGEFAAMAATICVAFCVSVPAVARNRHAAPPFSLGILDWIARLLAGAETASRKFKTPMHAQAWFEWRSKGLVTPIVVVCGLMFVLGVWSVGSGDAEELFHAFVAGGGLLIPAGVIGGLVLGSLAFSSGKDLVIVQFLATRPLSDTELARAVLWNVAKSVFAAWLVWAAAFFAYYIVLLIVLAPVENYIREFYWWYFPATLVGPWIAASTMATAMMTGNVKRFILLFFGSAMLFLGLTMTALLLGWHEWLARIHAATITTLGAAFAAVTVWAYAKAVCRRLIGWATVYVGATIALVLYVGVWLAIGAHPDATAGVMLFFLGLTLLAVAPLAAAPLAVAWNRHR
jgi:hypothetical protein